MTHLKSPHSFASSGSSSTIKPTTGNSFFDKDFMRIWKKIWRTCEGKNGQWKNRTNNFHDATKTSLSEIKQIHTQTIFIYYVVIYVARKHIRARDHTFFTFLWWIFSDILVLIKQIIELLLSSLFWNTLRSMRLKTYQQKRLNWV